MSSAIRPSVSQVLREIAETAPGVPLLALGQTVFWDEPVKALILRAAEELGLSIRLVAGVHDTDYFAKLPGGVTAEKPFVALPRNDGSTRDFWSAAGEFSALFGSETPITRERLLQAGINLERLTRGNASLLDQATEAWGWRGIASTDARPVTTADIPTSQVFSCLQSTFEWALDLTVERLCLPEQREMAVKVKNELMGMLCAHLEHCRGKDLASYYQCLLPELQQTATGRSTTEITRTSELLRFNQETCRLPRFAILDLFLRPETRDLAKRAYDEAVAGTHTYTLEKFGTGAIPFDLVIPGEGRGTIRLTPKMLVVMTPKPVFVPLEKPIESVEGLALVCEERFPGCAVVGKAITLISMLAKEFFFLFHEDASMYVASTRVMHERLAAAGIEHRVHPILRVRLETWDALEGTDLWFDLPEPLRLPFGADHIPAETLARTWRTVQEEQRKNLELLGDAHSTSDAIRVLKRIFGGKWDALAKEYRGIRKRLRSLRVRLDKVKEEVRAIHDRLRAIKREWQDVERAKGEHFRSAIFGKAPTREDLATRAEFERRIAALRTERRELRERLRVIRAKQAELAKREEVILARKRRAEILREVETARLRVVRGAVMATEGLSRCNRRPSAWWFPVVSPDGRWIENVYRTMEMRIEELNLADTV